MLSKITLFLLILMISPFINGQKVGLVLSGGGALGLAHIGVLKALEENGIPIHYITGTSAGAMVGSMYASGWSPELMDSLVMSEKFQLMSSGGIETKFEHYFRKPEDDPSWVNIKMTKDFSLTKIIPTNFTNPVLLDFESMCSYSPISSMTSYDFDSLFVPFRCVASDVASKSEVVFDSGHLNQAVRASMTYPGYVKPIKVNGRLMFDGGLYNNFPTDVMYNEFFPDIIIGVNFTDTTSPPDEDDLFSQIKTMIIDRNPSSIVCDNGILIEPEEPISIFGFDEGDKAIKAGYDATMKSMDAIKALISDRISKEDVDLKRKQFYKNYRPIKFDEINVLGVSENVGIYIKKSLILKNEVVDLETLKKRYFRLVADEKLKFIYPLALFDTVSGNYTLHLDVYPEKPFSLRFGGVFSSKPINTGYVALRYARLGRIGFETQGESYFGEYYGSAKLASKFDFNFKIPFSIEGFFTLNRFDYFKSFSTFFEESKPSFIIENERYTGVNIILPVSYFGKFSTGYAFGGVTNSYYQTDEFTPSDTADITNLVGHKFNVEYAQSNLNRKQFASEGSMIKLNMSYFNGFENTTPGSTSQLLFPATDKPQEFYNFNLKSQKYFSLNSFFRIGISLEGNAMYTEKFLDNYTATVIASPSFQPTNESRAMFIADYATHFFAAPGIQTIFSITNNIDIRAEAYVFQPFYPLDKNKYNQPFYRRPESEKLITNSSIIGSASAVYHSPIGPLSFSLNYYEAKEKPLSFLVSFGYIIHNKRFLK
jgi:NTE family protein